jgi:hypothetical protein
MAAGRITLGEWQSMRQVWVARSEQLRRAIGEQVLTASSSAGVPESPDPFRLGVRHP